MATYRLHASDTLMQNGIRHCNTRQFSKKLQEPLIKKAKRVLFIKTKNKTILFASHLIASDYKLRNIYYNV